MQLNDWRKQLVFVYNQSETLSFKRAMAVNTASIP